MISIIFFCAFILGAVTSARFQIENLNKRIKTGFSTAVAFCTFSCSTYATTLQTTDFVNERYHTGFTYPSDWEKKNGELSGGRSLDAFVDPNDPETSVSAVYTPIPADYNRISSFGGLETIRQYLIPRGDGVKSTVLSEKLFGESYMAEYIVEAPDSPTRHVQTVFSLRPKESVVGLTVQTLEENYEKNKQKLSVIVPSFRVDLP